MNENKSLKEILSSLMLEKVPSYANKFFYSLGFLSMTSFLILIITGVIMVFFGPNWWLITPTGLFVRSLHLWATQAFIFFILLHLLIVFLSSGYKAPRRFTWVLGALMLLLSIAQSEFGYALRNDFSSQWRILQGADFYNGAGLGKFINTLNYFQIYGIHTVLIPALIIALLFFHYLLIKIRGIAKPFKKEVKYTIVKANHKILFIRGLFLILVLIILSLIFKAPYIIPTTIKSVALEDPNLIGKTLFLEFIRQSDTANYFDNIDPYKFDTRKIYVLNPYQEYIQSNKKNNYLNVFNNENKSLQTHQLKQTKEYFFNRSALTQFQISKNPLILIMKDLLLMAKSGLYEDSLKTNLGYGYNSTFIDRFIADTGVLDEKAQNLSLTTDQYGMLHEENKHFPVGAWWLFPIGLLDHTILSNDPNQDRDTAEILGLFTFLLVAFPYIPFLNKIPGKLPFNKWIWK